LKKIRFITLSVVFIIILIIYTCVRINNIISLDDLAGKTIGVPLNTVISEHVRSRITNVNIAYFESSFLAVEALKQRRIHAIADDEHAIIAIQTRYQSFKVLQELVTLDYFGFAVQLENYTLKNAINRVIENLRTNGTLDDMINRWLYASDGLCRLPEFTIYHHEEVLRFGTASTSEPFTFRCDLGNITGFDIELAFYIAEYLNKELEIIDMHFGYLISDLVYDRLDMIGGAISITDERKNVVLFSESYYTGGTAVLVRKPRFTR
jgi:polar amino acid transport system substrate-binding protein